MAPLSIVNAVKAYGQQRVIHGVDIEIADGEFVVLVGPSGCGKSTLLRMIAGLEDITSGEIRIDGQVVNLRHPKDRDIAMVFQNYALYPHMTVAENMAFSLRMQGADKAARIAKAREAAAILGLEPLLERYPRQLSGGQRQRVAMGRAIVRDPKVFLFDEPLSNLDAKLRVQMRAEIRELHQRLRTTIVYVTHDQIEAMTMADKIVVLRDGRVEQIGSPLELYDHPANLFVAGFLGSPPMNLLHGRLDAPQRFVTRSGVVIDLLQPVEARAGDQVILGVRPEHLVLSDGGFEAHVTVVEPTGAELQVVLKVGDQELSVVFRDRLPLRPGETVQLRVQPAAARLFDPRTERALNPGRGWTS